jgi:hypothetical protein
MYVADGMVMSYRDCRERPPRNRGQRKGSYGNNICHAAVCSLSRRWQGHSKFPLVAQFSCFAEDGLSTSFTLLATSI